MGPLSALSSLGEGKPSRDFHHRGPVMQTFCIFLAWASYWTKNRIVGSVRRHDTCLHIPNYMRSIIECSLIWFNWKCEFHARIDLRCVRDDKVFITNWNFHSGHKCAWHAWIISCSVQFSLNKWNDIRHSDKLWDPVACFCFATGQSCGFPVPFNDCPPNCGPLLLTRVNFWSQHG